MFCPQIQCTSVDGRVQVECGWGCVEWTWMWGGGGVGGGGALGGWA